MENYFIVFQDNAAGQMRIVGVDYDSNWTYQGLGGNFASPVFETEDKEKAKKYIEESIKASTKFVVFTDQDYNYWIEKMDCCSGTYQEVGGKFSTAEKEFSTEEEANKYIKNNA